MIFSPNANPIRFELIAETLRRAVAEVPAYSELRAPRESSDNDEILHILRTFPIAGKEDLRKDLSSFVSTSYHPETLREVFTGGSSGVPLRLLRDRSEFRLENSFVERAWAPFGLEATDQIVVLRARADPRSEDGIKYIDKKGVAWVSAFNLEEAAMDRILNNIIALKPALIRGFGSLVSRLFAHASKVGRTLPALKGVAYSSDEMAPHERAFIRNELGIKLISLYGQAERAAMAASDTTSDLHSCFEDYGFIELLRSDGSMIDEPDEQGEIVSTSLFKRATAMIRYRTGDISSWATIGSHAQSRQLNGIDGRSGAILTDRDGRPFAFSWDMKDSILKHLPIDVCVQFVQSRRGEITVKLDCGKRPDVNRVLENLEAIREKFDIRFEWNATLHTAPNGKRQLFVVSK